MEVETVDELPTGAGWQYEPKYDGFRCLAHRRGGQVHLQSRNQKPLGRYFPEGAQGLEEIAEADFVLDGELVIAGGSFESLQLRLHPAESRIRKLARETPAELIVLICWHARASRCSRGRSPRGGASSRTSWLRPPPRCSG
jgi:ATP-dependent DNA ligase